MGDYSLINTNEWIENNKQDFLPPVCNKMMHQRGHKLAFDDIFGPIFAKERRHNAGQMKLFFVGGPNQRKDYHIDCGEELFLMVKGDMVLKIREQGKHRDVVIKEGQMFLLPGRIEHSPQRFDNTVGLVLERERHPSELDGVRYFTEEKDGKFTSDTLYERWFHCTDLGTQLAPLIKQFFASEPCKTGSPTDDSFVGPASASVALDTSRKVEDPFDFNEWLQSHKEELDTTGAVQVFDGDKYQFQIYVYGKGENSVQHDIAEIWIWQWTGSSKVTVAEQAHCMKEKDSLLITPGQRLTVTQEAGSRMLVCYQDPTKSTTYPKHN